MLAGINHLTLAVNDLSISFDFYVNLLGFTPRARWPTGAYLSLGEFWLCLSVDDVGSKEDYTHCAFTIPENGITTFRERLKKLGVVEWRNNKSEGESMYFLDPDDHKLEVHCGSLETRLNSCREQPYDGMIIF